MTKISAVIITLNEEKNIERCIQAAYLISDEVIIVDSFSKDKTVEIARKLNCLVVQQKWLGYSGQKNLGNSKAKHSYILSLDADEEISPELAESILKEKSKGLAGAYSLNRLTNYCGKWIRHSGWYPDEKIRLFPKSGSIWEGDFVHETLKISDARKVLKLKGDLLHYSYSSFQDHRLRATKYARLAAEKMHANNKKVGPLKPILSGIAKFISMYFIKLGFLDGKMGVVLAWISAKGNVLRYSTLRRMN